MIWLGTSNSLPYWINPVQLLTSSATDSACLRLTGWARCKWLLTWLGNTPCLHFRQTANAYSTTCSKYSPATLLSDMMAVECLTVDECLQRVITGCWFALRVVDNCPLLTALHYRLLLSDAAAYVSYFLTLPITLCCAFAFLFSPKKVLLHLVWRTTAAFERICKYETLRSRAIPD